MKTPQIIFFLLTLFTSIHALAIPTSFEEASQLFKRKGGGGGGGRGGGSSSSSSSSSSSGSSSGGSRGSSSSSGSGGRSGGVAGVGPQPRAYAGGSYYGGGSGSAMSPGSRSRGGVAPFIVGGAGIGLLGGAALAGGYYYYPYGASWYYHNRTANENQTHPVDCYCGRYNPCGCDYRNESDYVDSVANNASVAQLSNVNGTDTLLVNGTLPNGTQAAVAGESLAAALSSKGQLGGWAVIGGAVAWGVWLL